MPAAKRKTAQTTRVISRQSKWSSSPHVAYVSRTTISFSQAFKEAFWRRYCDGVPPAKIFEDAGLNIGVIGKGRIDTLVKSLRDQFERGLPFKDGLERHAG